MLYLLSKAKSLATGKWVWRGISASPSPVLDKQQLWIPQNFQFTEIRTISAWFQFVARKGAQSLCEIDCKKQLDNIKPGNVTIVFTGSADWLYKKWQWRQTEVVWSISRDSAKLDRAGEAASHQFWYVPHDVLSKMLHFEMHENNFLLAGGSMWQRLGSIPMGGPFSAQSADLHTLWGVKTQGKKMRYLGSMTISDEGFPV